MKGKKVQQKTNIINKQYQKSNNIGSYKKNNINNNNEISPHLNVLQFDLNEKNNINNINNNYYNRKTKNVRTSSQKPIRPTNNINIQNNNYYFNNINNNFIVKNSNPINNQINNQINNVKQPKINSQKQLKPLNANKYPQKQKQKQNKDITKKPKNILYNNKNDNIKIILDGKGVYISEEEDVYEDPNDPVNNLNTALKYKQKNNLQVSQEEKNMIETIKKVASNRVQYRNTHQMLKEIGKIMKDPVVSFLIKKEPEIKEESPSDKLSEMLSKKMLEEQKQKMKEKEEDLYYDQLQKRIKDEIRNKGSFDFAKLPDKDRKMLAQRKVYNKIGLKVYEDGNSNNPNNNSNNPNNNNENINERLDNQIKKEINREKKKEEFLNEIEKYKEKEEEDDYFNMGEINNKNIKGFDDEDEDGINYGEINNEKEKEKEKPTARNILEKVLNKIEYKNEQLINHNKFNEISNNNNKKENVRKKNF